MNNIELLRSHKQLINKITEILHKYDFNQSTDLYIPTEKPDTLMLNIYDCSKNTTIYIIITEKEYLINKGSVNKPIKTKYVKEAKALQKLIFYDN